MSSPTYLGRRRQAHCGGISAVMSTALRCPLLIRHCFRVGTSVMVSLFNSRDRFFQFASGRRRRLVKFSVPGLPWLGSQRTRVFLGCGLSRTKYELFDDVDDTSLFGRPPGIQSQLSLGITRSTLNHPLFPTLGSRQNVTIEQNGGFLGGDGNFNFSSLG